MAHVFQMMAGTSRSSPPSDGDEIAKSLLESIPEYGKEEVRHKPSPSLTKGFPKSDGVLSCPVCGCENLSTLSQLGQVRPADAEDADRKPDIRIGVTGIVLPDQRQLARWFKVPVPPKFKRSPLHLKATREGKQYGTVTFFSTFSFETVFFSPALWTMAVAFLASSFAAVRSWKSVKKLACEEDKGIALEVTVRKQAYSARNDAWERLYYCGGCGMVHDRDRRRSLPWYSMLQLVHYCDLEFPTPGVPNSAFKVEEGGSAAERSHRAA